jgi:ABC-type multidrug transport system fused ATPase/permease subunit
MFLSLATSVSTRPEVCAFGLKDWILETYEKASTAVQKAANATQVQYNFIANLSPLVSQSSYALSHILVATQYSHAVTLATMSLLQNAMQGIIYDLNQIYYSGQRLFTELETIKMYIDFVDPQLNTSSLVRMEPHAPYSEPTGRGMKLEAENLVFGYPNPLKDESILKGLNFVIEPGEFVAVVGGNGSGKSTLVKLLLRMYDVTSGSLKINGVDIRRYDMDELWSHMSLINQEYGKLHLYKSNRFRSLYSLHRGKYRNWQCCFH